MLVKDTKESVYVKVAEDGKNVQMKGETKSIQSKSDAKSVHSQSDAKSVQSKSDAKSVQSKSDAKSVQSKSDAKSVQSKSDVKSVQSKSDAKSVQSKSDAKFIQVKLDAKPKLVTKQEAKSGQSPLKEEVDGKTITVCMDCDGLQFYRAAKDETVKSVLKHFLSLREKREVTKEELKGYFLVTKAAPTQPLAKKKTLEACGVANNSVLERSDSCGHSA